MRFIEPRSSDTRAVILCYRLRGRLSAALLSAAMLVTGTSFAADNEGLDRIIDRFDHRHPVEYRLDGATRIRGIEFRDRMYFGQARIGDSRGVGLIIDRGEYAYGASHLGFVFIKRF